MASKTISDLVDRFNGIEAEVDKAGLRGGNREKEIATRKAALIRDFPIPNSRADLQSLIYFIQPKIEDSLKPDPNAEDWRVKFREVLNLAKNAYKDDAATRVQFEEIERSLNTTLTGSLQTRVKRSPVVAVGVALVVILVIIGVVSTQIDKWKLKQCEERYAQGAAVEKTRLDGVVAAINIKLKEMKFPEAQASLHQLSWEYKESCKIDEAAQEKGKWEGKRKELMTAILQAETSEAVKRREAANSILAESIAEKTKEKLAVRKAAVKREW